MDRGRKIHSAQRDHETFWILGTPISRRKKNKRGKCWKEKEGATREWGDWGAFDDALRLSAIKKTAKRGGDAERGREKKKI